MKKQKLKPYVLQAVLLSMLSLSHATLADDTPKVVEEGQALIKQFSGELKSNLKTAIQTGGFAKGIESCSLKAPQIADKYSRQGWQIRRASLKPRNPHNMANAYEQKVLREFEAQLIAGTPMSELITHTSEHTNGTQIIRLVKAIPTQKLCLNCHGSNLSKEVSQLLQEHYPDDQATGYQEGDIRGAFSLSYQAPTQ